MRPLGQAFYATESTSNLKKAAFPLKDIVARPESYQRSVDLRNVKLHDNLSIADLVKQHYHVVDLKKQRQKAATERNAAVEAVKEALAKSNQRDVLPSELKQRSADAKKLVFALERQLSAAETSLSLLLETVPNLIESETAKVEGEFELVSQSSDNLLPHDRSRDHVVVGTKLGILDLAAASKVCGSGNAYLVGRGALLEQALISYALRKCSEFGFSIVSTPSLIRSEFIDACGFQPRDESTHVYKVEDENLCLSGTAEIPLASQLAEQQLKSLPIMHCAAMRSFRAEAASKGSDTRGLYRLHEFSKVEMFAWEHPDRSAAMLDKLVGFQQSIFTDLLSDINVPLRTIRVGPTDLGAPAFQKYDIEAWMPGRGTWGEISSASNCLDFQARRLHTTTEDNQFVHTLNATALAVPRIIVAIIESGWDENTETVKLPKVLHPFMGPTL